MAATADTSSQGFGGVIPIALPVVTQRRSVGLVRGYGGSLDLATQRVLGIPRG